jgi:hypothetical protein
MESRFGLKGYANGCFDFQFGGTMSDPTITIDQMRAERDAARQEAERLAAELEEANDINGKWHEGWEKDYSRELRRLADLTSFEWEVDGDTADVIREHIELTLQQRCQEADQNAALVGELQRCAIAFIKQWDTPMRDQVTGIGIAIAALGRTLSLTPPAALERVQREAAAKALEDLVADHYAFREMFLTEGGEPYVLRAFSHDLLAKNIRKRAAELREGK